MGNPSTPQEAAPAYDDVFHDHPVNRFAPSGSASVYSSVPQEDVELGHTHHTPPSTTAETSNPPESLVQTIAGVFRPKPHVHCEQCDVQTEARERRENEKHCCTMVAVTFMTAFFCVALVGIVVSSHVYKLKRLEHKD